MSELVLNWYLRLFDRLSFEYKTTLIDKLNDRLKHTNNEENDEADRRNALEGLINSWSDSTVDGDFILNNRTSNDVIYDL